MHWNLFSKALWVTWHFHLNHKATALSWSMCFTRLTHYHSVSACMSAQWISGQKTLTGLLCSTETAEFCCRIHGQQEGGCTEAILREQTKPGRYRWCFFGITKECIRACTMRENRGNHHTGYMYKSCFNQQYFFLLNWFLDLYTLVHRLS